MSMINQNIALKQKQELALKPKMLQSLKMLALPYLELEAYIKQELQNNPLLELRDEKDDDPQRNEPETEEKSDSTEDAENKEELEETLAEAKELTEILDQWNDYHTGSYSPAAYDPEQDQSEAYIRYEGNSKEMYLEQLYPLNLAENETEFITELVDSCDIYGFLPEAFDLGRLAKSFGISAQRANTLHQIVLKLSPQGITARNISECLIAQLSEEQLQNRIIYGLVTDHFEDLIHRRYQKIASHFGISESSILAAKEHVARLDPKPGLRILSSNAVYVYPDVTLKMIDNEYVVIINDQISPNIIISSRYRKMISRGRFDRETTSFVRERINSAKFLIKSIHMRTRTLEQVALSIVKHQHDFFYKGTGIMQPLTYSSIALDLSKSESTISRVVKDKYVETPYGIFAFKDFFTSTAGRDDNFESISRQNVKSCIIRLIESEDKTKPYSDQELVDILKAEGMNISRRIINKYRDELGILNSRLRRE